jgi:uncharacterized protein YdeI (YjbR/CyaY-like superfamily)
MKKSRTNPSVDPYFKNASHWQPEIKKLRQIALDCGLTEELKWRSPCYTFQDGNVAVIQMFKDYCALMFFKGALMKDPAHMLVQLTETTQGARQARFTDVGEIVRMEAPLKAYLRQAMEIEKAGLKVKLKETADFEVPAEFQSKLNASAALRTAFTALTPGRQRGYLLYFAAPKQSTTRESESKCVPQILKGKG